MTRTTRILGLAMALAACGPEEPARLEAEILERPVATPTTVRGADLWSLEYTLRVRTSNCVPVTLTFLQVDVVETSFEVAFGLPDTFDAQRLSSMSASEVAACGPGVDVRSRVGSLGGGVPRGPARFTIRAVGVDDRDHEVGLDRTLVVPISIAESGRQGLVR